MAAVIYDDVKTSNLLHNASKKLRIRLIAPKHPNTSFLQSGLVINIDAVDAPSREETLPHLQRFAARCWIGIPSDSDFKHADWTLPQPTEVRLIVLRVPVISPFVGPIQLCQFDQVIGNKERLDKGARALESVPCLLRNAWFQQKLS